LENVGLAWLSDQKGLPWTFFFFFF
jgi:hypothetical protein